MIRATPVRRTLGRLPRSLALLAATLGGAACAPGVTLSAPEPVRLADPAATIGTRALFVNLRRLRGEGVLFGHQNDLAYGVRWRDEPGRSDVREVAGAYPAVFGWDANMLWRGRGLPDEEGFASLQRWIREGYERGGVNTVSWHAYNPVTLGTFYDTTSAVPAILPGGARHEHYRAMLDRLASFFHSLRGPRGEPIPVIFRPFHEHTGSWFWWGERHATRDEFVALWRFTVRYLRDEKRVHNLLYAYSTDVFRSPEHYLERYPGDEYIDLLGFDDYQSVRTAETRPVLARRLRELVEMAEARGKLAALTETGVEGIPDPAWWTEVLLPGIEADPVGRRISYLLVWRNANEATDRKGHFYAPYPGHPSAPDFVRFRADPGVRFADEIPDLYRIPR